MKLIIEIYEDSELYRENSENIVLAEVFKDLMQQGSQWDGNVHWTPKVVLDNEEVARAYFLNIKDLPFIDIYCCDHERLQD